MTPLTPHFSLEELTASNTAARLGIDNTPPPEIIATLKRTATGMEFVRARLNSNAIHISSGYRCEALERDITRSGFRDWCAKRNRAQNATAWVEYFATKQHPKGEAVDFTAPTYGAPSAIIRAIKSSEIEYDQLIAEYGDTGWVHISFSDNPRRQFLTIG